MTREDSVSIPVNNKSITVNFEWELGENGYWVNDYVFDNKSMGLGELLNVLGDTVGPKLSTIIDYEIQRHITDYYIDAAEYALEDK